jgi:integrase
VEVAKFRDDRLKEVSAQSVIHELNTLSVIFEYARIDLGVFQSENPIRLVRKPTREKARSRRVSELEMEWLLKSASAGQSPGMNEIITLAVETSMRLGELLGLEWPHINQKKRVIHLSDTKNGDSRDVAMTTLAIKTVIGMPRNINGRLFGWRRADSFEHTWKRCVKRAQAMYGESCVHEKKKPAKGFLAEIRFHDLRHEATSRLFELGLNPFEVASMTGHKSMQMLKRYTHVEASKLAQKLR